MVQGIVGQKLTRTITCGACGSTWIPMIDKPRICQFCHARLTYEKETRPDLPGAERVQTHKESA